MNVRHPHPHPPSPTPQIVDDMCMMLIFQVDNVTVEGRTKRQVPGYVDGVEFGVLSTFAYPVEDSGDSSTVNSLPPHIQHSSSLSQFKTSPKTFTSAFSELP